MRPVHHGPFPGLLSSAVAAAAWAAACSVGGVVVVSSVAGTVGLGGAAWVAGLAATALLVAGLATGMERYAVGRLGPADHVTLLRAALVCGVAALTVEEWGVRRPVTALVVLAGAALVLDAVDGRVARRTGTSSSFGARFDMEVDAFLILVLSVGVAHTVGGWVLLIGAARYVLAGAAVAVPWLRGSVPPRPWCKVVAAVQGVTLTVALSGVLPRLGGIALLLVALCLLVESFGREVWDLHRAAAGRPPLPRGAPQGTATVVAGTALWAALLLPGATAGPQPLSFLRIPLEGLVAVAVLATLGRRSRSAAAAAFGLALAVVVVVSALDLGFHTVLDRPFNPVSDPVYLGPAYGVLVDSVGRAAAVVTAVVVVLLLAAVLVLLPLASLRLAAAASRHRGRALTTTACLAVAWGVCAVTGAHLMPAAPVATASAAEVAVAKVDQARNDLRDQAAFAAEIGVDAFAGAPDDRLLTALRGKDVLLVFVESYGRVAVQDSTFSPGVSAVLDRGTGELRSSGFGARSAFLTSPTFGAASWLAHATLQAGLWVDSQRRYDQLMGQQRLTLSDAFGRAGWRTVLDVPANTGDWPDGKAFYGVDELYDARNVGYRGPKFGYASMPDQYTLAAFWRRELAPDDRAPVMAEIDLISSHHPWAPLPRLVDPRELGDGSVFDGMPEQGDSAETVFADPDRVREAYGRSVEYSWSALVSFLTQHPDPDLVLVVLGDHQPHSYVTGPSPGHDVPVSVIARDPAVLARLDGWDWQDGLRPGPDAAVWRMDTFRDRFLDAFGTEPH